MSLKVYTKTGDKGTTALIGGTRVAKDHIRIEAYGTVDELNSFVGVLNDQLDDSDVKTWLFDIQNRLFDLGAVLATDPHKDIKMQLPDIEEQHIAGLEQKIDQMEEALPPLKHFILPGGHQAASAAHVCRSVCRRAERNAIHLQNQNEPVNELAIKYLNRLSDFFFVLSRFIIHNHGGIEIQWRPNG